MKSQEHAPYLDDDEYYNYLLDMIFAQNYAYLNRVLMVQRIVLNMGHEFDIERLINTRHNYIDFDRFIMRKGAISAESDEICIISLIMRDGILLCRGKESPDWNYSSAHGCGRILIRTQASRLNLKEFQKQMRPVYSMSILSETLDESPMAYRDVNLIKNMIGDSVEIIEQLYPIINVKGW